jgi:hypothetical protein
MIDRLKILSFDWVLLILLFFAEIVVGDVCNCNFTGLRFGSVVVFDVNTASVFFTSISCCDNDDS